MASELGLTRVCKACGTEKPLAEFTKTRQWYFTRCKQCDAKKSAEYRKHHPDKTRELRRRWEKKWRTERREDYRASRRRRYNPERAQRLWAERRQWLSSGDVTKEQLISIYESCEGRCAYCGVVVTARFTPNSPRGFDHVISRSKGGAHTAANIVVSCRHCNELKSDSS